MANKSETDLDLNSFPEMTHWFGPIILAKLGWQAIVAALFGQYADQRTTQAALDSEPATKVTQRYDYSTKLTADPQGAVWLDYVADLGDGFDATYTVASILAMPELNLKDSKGTTHQTPRGQILVMGGDEVYPTASRDAYWERTRQPYELAFPERRGTKKVPFFAIPGNHDWYDGLESFHDTFCRTKTTGAKRDGVKIGSWQSRQHRSYFALKLPFDWHLWGLDIQLGGFVDQPQLDYFKLEAKKFTEKSKVIICTAQPSWLKAKNREDCDDQAYKSMLYVKHIAESSGAAGYKKRVCALIAGDLHHYSRYAHDKEEMQLVTAGGGGAFLHATHHLPDRFEIEWYGAKWNNADAKLCHYSLYSDPVDPDTIQDQPAVYPSQDVTRKLCWDNWRFALDNKIFAVLVGVIYALVASYISMTESTVFNDPFLAILAAALLGALMFHSYNSGRAVKYCLWGIGHFALHAIAMWALAKLLWPAGATLCTQYNCDYFTLIWLVYMAVSIVIGGVIGGTIFGIFIAAACAIGKIHQDEAFSALRVQSYRNFLRLRLSDNALTIYPVGIDKVPGRAKWAKNQNSSENNPPVYVVNPPLEPHLIEGPVIITADTADM